MSKEFQDRKNKFETALNANGMSADRMQEQLGEVLAQVGPFSTDLIKRVTAQATYDQFVNIPTGTLNSETYDPKATFRSGLVGAIGALVEWDGDEALALCRAILEDVNLHDYAAVVQRWQDGEEPGK